MNELGRFCAVVCPLGGPRGLRFLLYKTMRIRLPLFLSFKA